MGTQKYTFVLVDDSDIDLLVNKRFIELSEMSKDVYTFTESLPTLEFIKKNEDKLTNVIFLIDLQIPDMNGFELAEKLTLQNPSFVEKCKIFILSSSIDLEDKLNAANIKNIEAMLSKPLNMTTLLSKLEPVFAK
ncbi:MAG: response regulator [Bacteroidia bacterium]|jgi:response regulator RpfG family c-di-GMP phosphodiesterase|nr:response regulator [Bacteroidia bacterium]MBP7261153.1 response regulator [Bacteroidia bacterium]MBP9180561.1 response regulator [Bacteroidia bacterium]MBP9724868.1 response regulator [Bacteroidia bacterium]